MAVDFRPVTRDDARAVKRLAVRAFGPTSRVFVSLERGGHVAVSDGAIVGATILKVFRCAGRRVGLVSWIMVDPDAQGQGIASRLLELAHAWFAEQRADALLALVEGYNQSSSKLFRASGYRRLSLAEQLRTFRRGTLKAWLLSFYLTAIGHFIWFREAGADPGVPPPGDEAVAGGSLAGLLNAIAVNAIVLAVIVIRQGVRVDPWVLGLSVLGVPAALVLVRAGVFALVARARGLRTRYDSWLGGAPLALVVAAAFGAFLPVPGTVYPRRRTYRYREVLHAIGPAAFGSATVMALLLAAAHVARRALITGAATGLLLDVAVFVLLPLVVIDALLPVFPLWGFHARQVWNWNRGMWVLLALIAAAAVAVVHAV